VCLNLEVLATLENTNSKLMCLHNFFMCAKEQALGRSQSMTQVDWVSGVVTSCQKFERDMHSLFSNVDYILEIHAALTKERMCVQSFISNVDYILEICATLTRWRGCMWSFISNLSLILTWFLCNIEWWRGCVQSFISNLDLILEIHSIEWWCCCSVFNHKILV
jgi:hypothetical protein